jgi:hypothetical protein
MQEFFIPGALLDHRRDALAMACQPCQRSAIRERYVAEELPQLVDFRLC